MALYTFQGISTLDEILILLPRTINKDFKKMRWWILNEIYLNGALPTILFGLRISFPIALVVIVATEMMYGTTYGLGSRIITSQLAYRIPSAWSSIIMTGVLGLGLNAVLRLVERKYSFWVSK
jgi:NitT/TauT family transport system permease protein